VSWNVEKVLDFLIEIDAEVARKYFAEAANERYSGDRQGINLREIFASGGLDCGAEWLRRLELDPEVNERIRGAWKRMEPRKDDGDYGDDGIRNTSVFDRLAWYQPIHSSCLDWGIYIKTEGIVRLAEVIAGRAAAMGVNFSDPRFVCKCLMAGFFSLYLHEAYHHKVESFALRLAVVERRSSYLAYTENVYQTQLRRGDGPLEEALANADCYRRILETKYSRALGPEFANITKTALAEFFKTAPPGYREAWRYFGNKKFEIGQNDLMSQIQEARPDPKRVSSEWEISPQLVRGLSNFNSDIWLIEELG